MYTAGYARVYCTDSAWLTLTVRNWPRFPFGRYSRTSQGDWFPKKIEPHYIKSSYVNKMAKENSRLYIVY